MKKFIVSSLLSLALCATLHGALYTFPSSPNFTTAIPNSGVIPDNNIIGLTDVRDLSGEDMLHLINTTYLTLNFSSGTFVGDLHGFLRLGDTVTSPSANFNMGAVQNGVAMDLSSTFYGCNPNSNWTLFLADGDPAGISTLVSWELNIGLGTTPVPEPIHYALGIFGLVFVGVRVGRFYSTRRQAA